MGSPVEVFLSYAAEDEALRRELRARLVPLERDGVVRVWDASATGAGHAWHEERAARLHAARVVVLLVSADYLASDDLHREETVPSLERRANGEALVLAVLVRACGWEPGRFPVDALLPRNGRPVASWPNRDEAWADVAAGLREAVEALSGASASRSAANARLPFVPFPRNPGFVGREEDLAEVHALLQRARARWKARPTPPRRAARGA